MASLRRLLFVALRGPAVPSLRAAGLDSRPVWVWDLLGHTQMVCTSDRQAARRTTGRLGTVPTTSVCCARRAGSAEHTD
jgi:hypothetical protein